MISSLVVRSPLLVALLASTGCHALLGIDDFKTADAGPGADAPSDTFVADAQLCFGTLKSICLATPPLGTVIIAGTLNTTSDPRCVVVQQGSGLPELCVIPAGTISIENTIVIGTRPLVFIAAGSITVNGAIDASSIRGGRVGAAASTLPCVSSQNGMQGDGGGGAGGSFGTMGAGGGRGGAGGTGAAGGTAGGVTPVTAIRGGCAGGLGGKGGGPSEGAIGPSGGALAFYAGSQIAIVAAGSVYASGAGGGAGVQISGTKGGGGGGGSGGLIVLDAPSIQVLGTVTANGGGGGGGGDGSAGQPGVDGTTSAYSTAASGGAPQGSQQGGPGGRGSAVLISPAPGGSPPVGGNGGGGGGGGGLGVIWVQGSLAGAGKFSPAPELH